MIRERFLKERSIQRVVIKVGTSLITSPGARDGVSEEMLSKLRDAVLFLQERGIQSMIVSSGAVGTGRQLMARIADRRDTSEKTGRSSGAGVASPQSSNSVQRRQALAAIGQSRLMARYSETFEAVGIPVAQLLITARDFRDRRAYLNIGHTLNELRNMSVLPIVNENDTVSTEELQFGDNDLLSAIVAGLFRADLLIILTSVDGFLVDGTRAAEIARFDQNLRAQAGGPAGPGRGGMATKVRAGELCSLTGGALAILPGANPDPVRAFFAGQDIGTFIQVPRARPLSARKQWLLFARAEGGVSIDEGAVRALVERGSSLLPVGIKQVRGRFLAGEVIEIETQSGELVGRGISNYSYREVQSMLGLSAAQLRERNLAARADEILHRDNLILESPR